MEINCLFISSKNDFSKLFYKKNLNFNKIIWFLK